MKHTNMNTMTTEIIATKASDITLISGDKGEREHKRLCVCPVLRELCVRANDGLWWWGSDAERTSVLAPLAPRLLNTRAGDAAAKRRAKHAAHIALREFAPMALEAAADQLDEKGIADQADTLRQHAVGLRHRPSANAAYAAAGAARAAAVAASSTYAYDAVTYAANAAYAAANAASAADAADAAHYVAYAAHYVAYAAANAADAATDADTRKSIRDRLLRLIDECIEIC